MKTFKCPYCSNRYVDKKALYSHMENKHENSIPKGYTAAQAYFNFKNNKTHGTCIIDGKETKWSEASERYERLCSESCKEKYREQFKERMKKKYGKVHLLDDPNQQKKMLANRSISGEYLWSDGKSKTAYTGSYELEFLKFLDIFMRFEPSDVIAPAPQVFHYKDVDGTERFYIPDFYIQSINTLVECKDGGSNPNKHHSRTEVDARKEALKDEVMKNQREFNYIKVTDKDHSQFLKFLIKLKNEEIVEKQERRPIIELNEEAFKLIEEALINNEMSIAGVAPIAGANAKSTVNQYAHLDEDLDDDYFLDDDELLDESTKIWQKVGKDTVNRKSLMQDMEEAQEMRPHLAIDDMRAVFGKTDEVTAYAGRFDGITLYKDDKVVWTNKEQIKNTKTLNESEQLSESLVILESLDIDADGTVLIKVREKSDFMARYNSSHKIMKVYKNTNNIEGMKKELAKLWYMYLIIEQSYVHDEPKYKLPNYERRQADAVKAKAFILNEFTHGLKFVLQHEQNFDFTDYFEQTEYNKDIIRVDEKRIKGMKKLIAMIIA